MDKAIPASKLTIGKYTNKKGELKYNIIVDEEMYRTFISSLTNTTISDILQSKI